MGIPVIIGIVAVKLPSACGVLGCKGKESPAKAKRKKGFGFWIV